MAVVESSDLPDTHDTGQPAVQSVDKALLILELLMREDMARTARDIAVQLHLNRTTVHRVLNVLMQRAWIEKTPGGSSYRLSLKFLMLSQLAGRSRNVVQEVRPVLDRLSDLTRETVHLGVLDGYEVVHLDKVDSPESFGISSRIGSRSVPHLTGLGKALLAAESDAFLEQYLSGMANGACERLIENLDVVRSEILVTRERGYSVDDEEDSIGVRCLGVAVLGPRGKPVLAISVTGPSPRFTRERLAACVPDVTNAARELSKKFGWDPSPDSTLR